MSRISRTVKNGKVSYRVSFWAVDGKRKSIRLGNIQKRQAEVVSTKVQELAESVRVGVRPDPSVIDWLKGISDDLREKLVTAGLTERIHRITLSELLDRFIENQSSKSATMTKFKHVKANLLAYFDGSIPIASITKGQAKDFRTWLATSGNVRKSKTKGGRTDLADNTVRRRTGIAKQMFAYAMDHGWLEANPFRGLARCVQENSVRQFFVPRESIAKAIETAPSAEWKATIALSRFGGMRCPSEVMRLKWEDVDFQARRLKIHASKSEHHSGSGIRYCPIFPELMPHLEHLAAMSKGAKPIDHVVVKNASFVSVVGLAPRRSQAHRSRRGKESRVRNHPSGWFSADTNAGGAGALAKTLPKHDGESRNRTSRALSNQGRLHVAWQHPCDSHEALRDDFARRVRPRQRAASRWYQSGGGAANAVRRVSEGTIRKNRVDRIW